VIFLKTFFKHICPPPALSPPPKKISTYEPLLEKNLDTFRWLEKNVRQRKTISYVRARALRKTNSWGMKGSGEKWLYQITQSPSSSESKCSAPDSLRGIKYVVLIN